MEDQDARDILLAIIYDERGQWEGIYKHLLQESKHTHPSKEEVYSHLKSSVMTVIDKGFPLCFGNTYHPPFGFYYYGNVDLLNSTRRLAVVGSRECSKYSEEATVRLLTELHKKVKDLTIVSGMAKGIDAIAMRTAIQNGDNVIAILGSGIDNPYPLENKDIYEYCKNSDKGLVISEYPDVVPPLKQNFPIRNRLIAALSHALFVPECHKKSGTSVTVRFALEYGCDIIMLPHNIDDNILNNLFIQDGAHVCLNSDDLADILLSSKK